MLIEDNLKLSVYEYFKMCDEHNSYYRGVGVITHKQMIFYSQISQDDYLPHFDIAQKIEQNIHPKEVREFYNNDFRNDAFLFSTGDSLSIDLPDSGLLSPMQATFLLDVIDQVVRINSEISEEKRKIGIELFCQNYRYRFTQFKKFDFDAMRKAIKDMVTPFEIEEEKIIGKTLSQEEIMNSIRETLAFNKCQNTRDLNQIALMIKKLINDNYYRDSLLKVLPDYEKTLELIDILFHFNMDISNLHLENINEELNSYIAHGLNTITSEEEIVGIRK